MPSYPQPPCPPVGPALLPSAYLRALVSFPTEENISLDAFLFHDCANFGYAPPAHERPAVHFEHEDHPYAGAQESALPLAVEGRMRQACELQNWLCLDAQELMMSTTESGIPNCEIVPLEFEQMNVRKQRVEAIRDATVRVQTQELKQLHHVANEAKCLFARLLIQNPTDMRTTPFPDECLKLMRTAGIEKSEIQNPLEMYKSLGKRLTEQEKKVSLLTLEILRCNLQMGRIGLYSNTGQFLKDQALMVTAMCQAPENAALMGEDDDIFWQLRQVFEDPIHSAWPVPVQPDFMGSPSTL